MEFEYAFLLDALLEEQAQNITMDTTRVPFRTAKRSFTIIDAPGHKEFLKNMITGAASADAAVLLVDALEGLREQTRRHCFLLSLLGLRQIVVAVNKMDKVDYRPEVFEAIRTELREFLAKLGVEPAHFIPISAKHGEGLLKASDRMPWYHGPTFLEVLESFRANPPASGGPLRLSVQDVYRFDPRRIIAGLVESGSVSVGDPIEFVPGGKRSRVKSIETWPQSDPPPRGPVGSGSEVAITLEDELFVELAAVWPHEAVLVPGSTGAGRLHVDPNLARMLPDAISRMQYYDTLAYLPDDIMTKDGGLAGSGGEKGGQDAEGGGFAGAVGAQEAVDLAGLALKTDVIDGADFAALLVLEALGQASGFDHVVGPLACSGQKTENKASESTTEEGRERFRSGRNEARVLLS